MKMFLTLALAMLTSASTPPADQKTYRVEDIAYAMVIDNTMFPIDLPTVGIFSGTNYVAIGVLHTNASISVYDTNGLQAYTAVYPPLAYDLHYSVEAAAGEVERCYLNRASTNVITRVNCSGMTYTACVKKAVDLEKECQKIDPPHPTNPTCP